MGGNQNMDIQKQIQIQNILGWDVYKTQHFQFYTDIHAKHLGGGYIFLKYDRAEPQFSFSFWYRNIDIPKYDKWGGWWGFGIARIAEMYDV